MRILKGVILSIIPAFLFMGCGDFSKNDVAKVSFEKLSEKEEQILNLTENRVFFYKVKNISKGKGYKIDLNYEVYKEGKEVKNEPILTSVSEIYEKGKENITLGINFKDDNRINCLLGGDGAYSRHNYKAEENIKDYFSANFAGDYDLELEKGKRVCLYYATLGNGISSNVIGMNMDSEEIKETINRNNDCIFLSISVDDFSE
ncbi:hypothetical protein [Clostridium perfringens]|uniref:hypothetical protein n=1 Tax=Clostridium perfringens TaxID=1502 RepID=UPI0011215280|nr:hypothetical protein [Clostridium perfringens]TPE21238.1 hypothetical protein FJM09_07435 [Clostridium perfringens]